MSMCDLLFGKGPVSYLMGLYCAIRTTMKQREISRLPANNERLIALFPSFHEPTCTGQERPESKVVIYGRRIITLFRRKGRSSILGKFKFRKVHRETSIKGFVPIGSGDCTDPSYLVEYYFPIRRGNYDI